MTRALLRLTPAQIRVLMLLDDGAAEDSIGMELDDFRGHELEIAKRLKDRGLVETQCGWRFTLWFRLTPAGRALLRTGLR